ncbi:MAG: ATP-binding protein [Thermodesulfovibrionales bacterium]|jgi:signal transduction histidine kinase
MFRFQPSIRQKITLGYTVLLALIIGLSVVTFTDLTFLEKKIVSGEVISEFFDTTLEVRRFEKNYFLYGQESDYRSTLEHLSKTERLLRENTGGFEAIVPPGLVTQMEQNMLRYRELMEEYFIVVSQAGPPERKKTLEGRIRETGKDITTLSEGIRKEERKHLQLFLSKSRRILIFSILSLSLLGLLMGHALSRVVVRPLTMLENSMEAIADGRFEKILIKSHDREIASLTRAVNKMLRELELRQRHLVQSEKLASLGTLLSGVAHELNNPLSNISTSSQILMEELQEKSPGPSLDPSFVLELLSQIEEQTERARNIVRSLLDFSRPKNFTKETLPLKGLFQDTIRFIRGQVPVSVEINLQIPEEITIMADKQRIQQAFLNLIKNAVEAIEGEGTVFVKAERHTALEKADDETGLYSYLRYRGKCTMEADTVDIEIRDTGPGIPADLLSRVFDPFFTTKDVGKGSGLGLFIVHEIIEEHEGCIGVESEPGKGTRFLIRLPVRA